MNNYTPLIQLPSDIQRDFGAYLNQSEPFNGGLFQLVAIRKTNRLGFESGRLIVLVVDENGFPMPNVRIAFSYSTADRFRPGDWQPPRPWQGDVVPTTGGGQIEHVQGSVIKEGQAGGITVYCLTDYASDVVSGLGMLADHTGLHLTFQLRRDGVKSIQETLNLVESRLLRLERIAAQMALGDVSESAAD